MKCFSLVLGARNTPARGRHFLAADDELIRAITSRHFKAGFTILNAGGGWFDPEKRKFVAEDSRQILVCAGRRRDLRSWCEELSRALHQKELLVVEIGPAVVFRPAGRRGAKKKSP